MYANSFQNEETPVLVGSTTQHRTQSSGEEIANTVSHGLGFLAAVATIPILVIAALNDGAAVDRKSVV